MSAWGLPRSVHVTGGLTSANQRPTPLLPAGKATTMRGLDPERSSRCAATGPSRRKLLRLLPSTTSNDRRSGAVSTASALGARATRRVPRAPSTGRETDRILMTIPGAEDEGAHPDRVSAHRARQESESIGQRCLDIGPNDTASIEVAIDHRLRDALTRVALGQSQHVVHVVDADVDGELVRQPEITAQRHDGVTGQAQAIAGIGEHRSDIFIADID